MAESATDQLRPWKEVVRQAITEPVTREIGIQWMAFLHTHMITWQPGVTTSESQLCAPLTMRGAAEVVATQWGAKEVVAAAADWPQNADEGGYLFWYYEYIHRGGWQKYLEIPPEQRQAVETLAQKVARDTRVVDVELES